MNKKSINLIGRYLLVIIEIVWLHVFHAYYRR